MIHALSRYLPRFPLPSGALLGAVLAISPAFCHAVTNGTFSPTPGVDYYCEVQPRIPLAIHVVRIERSRPDFEFHTTLGGNQRIGMAVLSDQVGFLGGGDGQPLAAINGDYFFMDRPFVGDPMNLHIRRGGELISAPGEDRAFFYLDAHGQPHITNAVSSFAVLWPNGKRTTIGLNQEREDGEAVLYTAAVGPTTHSRGIDLVLERDGDGPWLPLRIGQTLCARVCKVAEQNDAPIPANGLVLSLDRSSLNQLPALKPGLAVRISTATTPDLAGAMLAIGGGPTLVRAGKARSAKEFVGFQMRNPRSAMGWNSMHFFFVQADGRQPRHSMGMTLEELANYFVKLGCDYALNLDGGGSCATWLSGKIMNNPSQGRERPSANALVLVKKAKPGP